MQLPMTGTWTVTLHAVRPFAIHGDEYFELHVERHDAPETPQFAVRVAGHAFQGPSPAPGQVLGLSFLMGQVTAARVLGPT